MPTETKTLSETDRYHVWRTYEGGQATYHVELDAVTLRFDADEWAEFVVLARGLT